MMVKGDGDTLSQRMGTGVLDAPRSPKTIQYVIHLLYHFIVDFYKNIA